VLEKKQQEFEEAPEKSIARKSSMRITAKQIPLNRVFMLRDTGIPAVHA